MNEIPNINKDDKASLFNFNFTKKSRMKLYKEMYLQEPRMWAKKHHLMRMGSLLFSLNYTLYSLWRIYYSNNYSYSFFNIKFWKISMIIVNISTIYFNTYFLHDLVYSEYYEGLTDEEIYTMYESMIFKKKKKNASLSIDF